MSRSRHASPTNARLIERPDGFYWQEPRTEKMSGPYASALEAIENMRQQDDVDYEEAESLREMETEMGIADWMDPATGEAADSLSPHLSDE